MPSSDTLPLTDRESLQSVDEVPNLCCPINMIIIIIVITALHMSLRNSILERDTHTPQTLYISYCIIIIIIIIILCHDCNVLY